MKSIVRQLQEDATDSKVSVVSLLGKAKIIATKLRLDEFLEWINQEINGYDTKSADKLPPYRMVHGQLKGFNPFHGWQTIMFEDEKTYNSLSSRGATQPIGELENLTSTANTELYIPLKPDTMKALQAAIQDDTEIRFFTGKSEIIGILNGVRNGVLEWSLKLEEMGIVDDGLEFSKKDKETANKEAVKIGHIENFFGNMGDNYGSITYNISIKAISEALKEIKKEAPNIKLDKPKREKFNEIISQLEGEIIQKKPKSSKIISLLKDLKDIIKSASSTLLAKGMIKLIEEAMRNSQ